MRGLELVEPRQAQEVHARYACDPALMQGYLRRPSLLAKDRKINPIEVVPKPVGSNDGGNFSRVNIEGQDGVGNFLRVG